MGEPVDLGETKATALLGRFGREERLEYPLQNIGRDPGAGIGHPHGNEGALNLCDRLVLGQDHILRR